MLERVFDQVADGDAERVHVALHHHRLRRQLKREAMAGVGLVAKLVEHQGGQLPQVDRLALQADARLHPRELQQLGGGVAQALERAHQRQRALLGVALGQLGHQALCLSAGGGERGAQLVRAAGGKGPLGPHHALQSIDQGTDRGHHRLELGRQVVHLQRRDVGFGPRTQLFARLLHTPERSAQQQVDQPGGQGQQREQRQHQRSGAFGQGLAAHVERLAHLHGHPVVDGAACGHAPAVDGLHARRCIHRPGHAACGARLAQHRTLLVAHQHVHHLFLGHGGQRGRDGALAPGVGFEGDLLGQRNQRTVEHHGQLIAHGDGGHDGRDRPQQGHRAQQAPPQQPRQAPAASGHPGWRSRR